MLVCASPGSVPVLNVGGVDHHGQDHPERINDQVPLSPGDHLVSVLAPRSTLLGGLDTLAVNDAHAGALLPLVAVTDLGAQGVVELRPGAVVAPFAKVVVIRQAHPPRTR